MRELSDQEIKGRLINMLVDFSKYCDAHDLRYYLTGGTLLGAVRHKGFIPWDDDIDVSMPRPDYDKFIKLKQKEGATNLICMENGNKDFPFLKIVDEQTIVRQENITLSDSLGLWIDVFPHDGWAENEKEASKDLFWLKMWKYIFPYSKAKIGCGTTKFRMILKVPFILFVRCVGSNRIIHAMDKLARKFDYNYSNWVGNFIWATYGLKERVPKEWYSKRTKLQFEKYLFWAPYKWDNYLTNIYGNYRMLPPLDERKNHKMIVYLRDNNLSEIL